MDMSGYYEFSGTQIKTMNSKEPWSGTIINVSSLDSYDKYYLLATGHANGRSYIHLTEH
jgi:hypothetical protein